MSTMRASYGAGFLIVLLASFCGCSSRQQASGPQDLHTAAADTLREERDTTADRFARVMEGLQGEWIATRFDRDLRASRSVFRAIDDGRGTRMLWLDVRPDSLSYQFFYSFDLYDSAERKFDSLYPAASPDVYGLPSNYPNSDDTIGIFGKNDGLYWRNANNGPVVVDSFIRLQSDVQRYLRTVLIQGSYRDEKGKRVGIDADGLMIWGEDTLHCEVGHYFFWGMPVDDYLNITGRDNSRDTATRYGFRWKGETLGLYGLVDLENEAGPKHSPRPLHILTKQ